MLEYYTIWMHQIKTPIAAMRLILQEEDNPRSRELQAQLFRVEEYVQMVLAYLRMHSESTDFVLQEYELDGIVRRQCTNMRQCSSERGSDWNWSLSQAGF